MAEKDWKKVVNTPLYVAWKRDKKYVCVSSVAKRKWHFLVPLEETKDFTNKIQALKYAKTYMKRDSGKLRKIV